MKHHIMRISRDEWARQVFAIQKYYTAMPSVKGWEDGSKVLFLEKVRKADSIIGYGVIEGIQLLDDMSEEEKTMCQKHEWKVAVKFSDLKKFDPPKPVKDTLIGEWDSKGMYLHGRLLSDEEINSILEV